jgi:hypothetical protein
VDEKPRSDEKLKGFPGCVQVEDRPYTLHSKYGLWVNYKIRRELNRRKGPPDIPD